MIVVVTPIGKVLDLDNATRNKIRIRIKLDLKKERPKYVCLGNNEEDFTEKVNGKVFNMNMFLHIVLIVRTKAT